MSKSNPAKDRRSQETEGTRFCQFLNEIGFTAQFVDQLDEYFTPPSTPNWEGVKRKKNLEVKGGEVIGRSHTQFKRYMLGTSTPSRSAYEVMCSKLLEFMIDSRALDSSNFATASAYSDWIIGGGRIPNATPALEPDKTAQKMDVLLALDVSNLIRDFIEVSQDSDQPFKSFSKLPRADQKLIAEIVYQAALKAQNLGIAVDLQNKALCTVIESVLRLSEQDMLSSSIMMVK